MSCSGLVDWWAGLGFVFFMGYKVDSYIVCFFIFTHIFHPWVVYRPLSVVHMFMFSPAKGVGGVIGTYAFSFSRLSNPSSEDQRLGQLGNLIGIVCYFQWERRLVPRSLSMALHGFLSVVESTVDSMTYIRIYPPSMSSCHSHSRKIQVLPLIEDNSVQHSNLNNLSLTQTLAIMDKPHGDQR